MIIVLAYMNETFNIKEKYLKRKKSKMKCVPHLPTFAVIFMYIVSDFKLSLGCTLY